MEFNQSELEVIYELLKKESKTSEDSMINHLVVKMEVEGKFGKL
jgi:hypothetical protein